MQDRLRTLLEGTLCAVAIVLAALFVYGGQYRSGAVPFDLSATLAMPPWQDAQPAGQDITPDTLTAAQAQRYYPWYAWINSGQSMLWNNSEGLGTPFLAAWYTRALSPFSLPLYFTSLQHGLVLSAFLKMLVAGLAAYYAARRFAFAPPTALLAAIGYAFGAPFLIHSPAPISDLLPWLPLLTVFAERVILGQWNAWPLGAIVLLLIALGGDPLGLVTVAVLLLLYITLRATTDLRAPSTPRSLLAGVIAILIALALAAPQILPYRECVDQADILLASTTQLAYKDLFAIAHPALATGPGHASPTLAALLHIGLVPLLLLPLWLAVREFAQPTQRGRIETLALLALALSAAAIVAAPFLPALMNADGPGPQHFLLLNTWAFALLAAAAAQEWLELTIDEARVALKRLSRTVPPIWGALLVVTLLGTLRQHAGWAPLFTVLGATLAVFLLTGITLFRPNARVLSYGLALISAAALYTCHRPLQPETPAAEACPDTTLTTALRGIEGRIAGTPRLQEWPLALNGIQQIYPATGIVLNRLREFLNLTQEDPLLTRRASAQGLLLTKDDIRGPYANVRSELNLRQVFTTGAFLFRDTAAEPRARVIYAGRRIEKYDPEQVRSDAAPVLESSTLPEKDDGPVAKVAITSETPTAIQFKVEKTRPAVLILADAWYPGWRATVDGAPAEVVRVDGLFRGIELGEGPHEVLLEYTSVPLRWGLGIAALALLPLLLGLWNFLRNPSP